MNEANSRKLQSLIFTTDRNFRGQAVRMLNDCTFVGEKLHASTVEELTQITEANAKILNFVVDAQGMDALKLKTSIEKLEASVAGRDSAKIVVHLREGQESLGIMLKESFPSVYVALSPLKKLDFMKAFHSERDTADASKTAAVAPHSNAPAPHPGPTQAAAPEEAKKPTKDGNIVNFFETTQHIRTSIDAANSLMANPSDLGSLGQIGQRFNGIVGTFALLKGKAGYKQLFELATAVDDVCRTYQNRPEWTAVTMPHLKLILGAVKCAFLVLKDLREGQPPADPLIAQAASLFATYESMPEIMRRASESQDAVDALLEELSGQKAS